MPRLAPSPPFLLPLPSRRPQFWVQYLERCTLLAATAHCPGQCRLLLPRHRHMPLSPACWARTAEKDSSVESLALLRPRHPVRIFFLPFPMGR